MTNQTVLVKAGELMVAGGGRTLATVGLGSCVAVALYDPSSRVGGLAHALLPQPLRGRPDRPPGRFASTAIPELLDRMAAVGADPAAIHARLAGGASMFPSLTTESIAAMGERNVAAARSALEQAGIAVLAEDVGGSYGRSVYFHVADGRVVVRSVHQPEVVL